MICTCYNSNALNLWSYRGIIFTNLITWCPSNRVSHELALKIKSINEELRELQLLPDWCENEAKDGHESRSWSTCTCSTGNQRPKYWTCDRNQTHGNQYQESQVFAQVDLQVLAPQVNASTCRSTCRYLQVYITNSNTNSYINKSEFINY